MKIAAVQMDVVWHEPELNRAAMLAALRETAAAGARLTVFPECAITGYCYDAAADFQDVTEPIPGPSTDAFTAACRELNVYAVFGMLERSGERVYNAAVLVGPEGVVGSYRKLHLPYLGVDRFVDYGDRDFELFEVEGVRIGMLICYDIGFPEAARSLALMGADLIVLPTNWPPGAESMAEHCINTRAMENNTYVAGVNRIGTEHGFRFIGHSSICAPSGNTMTLASDSEAEI
ncbi:MAG: carbon-nitrogen hydrolase family protein, partial [Planctomycetaceae bacterium]|nr:carbon-nitrogen hydrolase family protein [Planctomycetaceae bacterium]